MTNGFGEIRQLGHVVTDMADALRYWTERLKIGPFILVPEIEFPDFQYRGQPTPSPVVSLAIAFNGNVQIELIQQHDERPSIYREFLSSGRSGLHHFSTWFAGREDYEQTRKWGLDAKFQLVQESTPALGTRFAYFESVHPAAPLFELSEALVPGTKEQLDQLERMCRDWDGKHPVRSPAELA